MIIITGASGFVGSNLIPYLSDKNYGVNAISLRYSDWEKDVNDAEVIINLVGKAHDHNGEATEKDFFDANYEIVKKLYSCFINSNASLFIHISSIAALEEETAEGTVSEDYSPNPKSVYGNSKRKAEEFLLSQELPEGKKVIILRPAMIHGPGDKGNLMLLYKIINKGIPYPLGAFKNKRSFIGIDNLCYVIHLIIEGKNNLTSGAYNIADDEPLSTLQIINTIGKLTERKPTIINVPIFMVNLLAKIGDILKLPLNSKRLVKMTSNLVVSNAALKNAININKFPLNAQEGLEKTIRSFIS